MPSQIAPGLTLPQVMSMLLSSWLLLCRNHCGLWIPHTCPRLVPALFVSLGLHCSASAPGAWILLMSAFIVFLQLELQLSGAVSEV